MLLHRGLALCVGHRTCGIERGGATVDEVDESSTSQAFRTFASHTFHGLWTPVGADVAEHHASVGQQVAKEHGKTVQEVVLSGEHISLTRPVPVERGAEYGFWEVEVGLVVCPLTLTLHTAEEGIVAQRLLFVAHLQQTGIAVHQVADNHHRLHRELPISILLLAILSLSFAVEGGHRCAWEERTVFIIVVSLLWLAVFLHPLHGLLELFWVVDAEIHTAQNLHQRHILRPHA